MADPDYGSSSDDDVGGGEEYSGLQGSVKMGMSQVSPVVDRNTHYKNLGWIPPLIPNAHQVTRQDLVILMTICSQVYFLSTGVNSPKGHLKPSDVCSALTKELLDIEQVLLEGRARDTQGRAEVAGIPKVIVVKKGAHSPIETPEPSSLAPSATLELDAARILAENEEEEKRRKEEDDEDSLCRVQ